MKPNLMKQKSKSFLEWKTTIEKQTERKKHQCSSPSLNWHSQYAFQWCYWGVSIYLGSWALAFI
jgi:hypothetical protein